MNSAGQILLTGASGCVGGRLLPLMVTPCWVRVTAQLIAMGDVLAYLRAALSLKLEGSLILEIGGPDQVSGRVRGLHRT